MASMTSNTFTIQPWARKPGDQGSLKDVLARVNFERGHFRDITEASLQEEIATEGALELSESDDEEEEDDDVERNGRLRGKPSTREELYKARYEMLGNVRAAEQEILMSLDFISLLVSKDAPKQGAGTISPFLKSTVPVGSLGTDLWQRMPVDKPREAQDELLAANVKLESLQQSADDLLSAATRLQDNVRRETEYWNQVLSISEHGWNVSRIPGPQHKLGVRFGFSESAPEFARRGMAALNAGADGRVLLDRGVGRKPMGLHAVIRRGGMVVGTSRVPGPPDPEETTLEARIRHARDSLYDEELYHEMIRESRMLSSLGVSMRGSAIHFAPQAGVESDISFDLVSLDEVQNFRFDSTNPADRLADAAALAVRLLLSRAHRERLKSRSAVPRPVSDTRKDEKPPIPILRPLLSFVMHQAALEQLNGYFDSVAGVLENAGIRVTKHFARLQLPRQSELSNAETLTTMLMEPWESPASLVLEDSTRVNRTTACAVHTDLSNSSAFASTLILTATSHGQMFRFNIFDEFRSAADANLSASLAAALIAIVGSEWDCDESEATLEKDSALDEDPKCLWVELDSGKHKLTLSSNTETKSWTTGGEGPTSSFWEAATEFTK
jgi:mediator of RNA polymerase II transcription subunit 17, fungi type